MTKELDVKIKIKNQLYKLLCQKEQNELWEEQLDNIVFEVFPFYNRAKDQSLWNVFLAKLSLCKFLSYKYFRKSIFECMTLIDEMDTSELF